MPLRACTNRRVGLRSVEIIRYFGGKKDSMKGNSSYYLYDIITMFLLKSKICKVRRINGH